jgi:hypothetical protein
MKFPRTLGKTRSILAASALVLPGMASLHANSAREALVKMCTLPLLAGDNISAMSEFSTAELLGVRRQVGPVRRASSAVLGAHRLLAQTRRGSAQELCAPWLRSRGPVARNRPGGVRCRGGSLSSWFSWRWTKNPLCPHHRHRRGRRSGCR